MAFRKLKGVRRPEDEQGLIRFTCLCWRAQNKTTRKKIDRICRQAGGPYFAALRQLMTTHDSMTAVAQQYHVSERTLYRCRQKFYERW